MNKKYNRFFWSFFAYNFLNFARFNQSLVKIVNVGMHPIFQVGIRSLVASIPVIIFCLLFKKLSISDGSLVPGVICGSLFDFEFVLLFFALELTSVSRSSILFYSMPVVRYLCSFLI